MQTYTIIFGFLLCLAASNAWNFERRNTASEVDDHVDTARRAREHTPNQRHKRRSWHSSYGYDYPQPPNPFYQNRRDYEQQNQDLIPQIWRLLDEISSYVKRPQLPAQPQPIYIPYAVPYPVPQTCKCITNTAPNDDKNITFGNRFKGMEDEQNWGLVDSNEGDDDEGDGSRPISFAPLVPKRPSKRPAIKVEHGSQQSGSSGASAAVSVIIYTEDIKDDFPVLISKNTSERSCFCIYLDNCRTSKNFNSICTIIVK